MSDDSITTTGGYVETTTSARPGTAGKTTGPIPADMSLPSEHIAHAAVLRNQLNSRLGEFDGAIIALEQERTGQIELYTTDAAEREAKHKAAITNLDNRIEDLRKGRRALEAALGELERK